MPTPVWIIFRSSQRWANRLAVCSIVFAGIVLSSLPARGVLTSQHTRSTQLAVPILGVTLDQEHHPVGIVTHVVIFFEKRSDHNGLQIRFRSHPGRFSPFAQEAVYTAIMRACQVAHLQTNSWTILLTFPYEGLTLYGDSLSAMIGLSVVAMAKGDHIIFGRSITGTITKDGHIGVVGGIPHKINAAYAVHMNRVLIPEEQDTGDQDWQTPFLMQVSPVGTVHKAYYGLTGHFLAESSAADHSLQFFALQPDSGRLK